MNIFEIKGSKIQSWLYVIVIAIRSRIEITFLVIVIGSRSLFGKVIGDRIEITFLVIEGKWSQSFSDHFLAIHGPTFCWILLKFAKYFLEKFLNWSKMPVSRMFENQIRNILTWKGFESDWKRIGKGSRSHFEKVIGDRDHFLKKWSVIGSRSLFEKVIVIGSRSRKKWS